jgi:hypothetical protein
VLVGPCVWAGSRCGDRAADRGAAVGAGVPVLLQFGAAGGAAAADQVGRRVLAVAAVGAGRPVAGDRRDAGRQRTAGSGDTA